MATMPPEPPTSERGAGGMGGYTLASNMSVARLPIPGNAEFAIWFVLEIVFVIIWIVADSVNTFDWVLFTTALTFGYFLSRGIAKASRVLEQ